MTMTAQENAAIAAYLAAHKVTKLPTLANQPHQVVHVRLRTRMLGAGWISQQVRDRASRGE